MGSRFKPAEIQYYIEWMKGYFQQGGKPTHYYDYSFSREGFVTVTGRFDLRGASGKSIIVFESDEWDETKANLRDNKLYYMDGYRIVARSVWVPVYKDDIFLRFKGIAEFIRADRTKRNAILREKGKYQIRDKRTK